MWFEDFFLRYNDLEGDLLPESHDAVQRIIATKPHVFLLDIPSTGSFDTDIFKKIRAIEPYLPIITLTETAHAKERLQSLEHGAYSSIENPCAIVPRSIAPFPTLSRATEKGTSRPWPFQR